MASAGGSIRLVYMGSSSEILLFSVAALHKSLTPRCDTSGWHLSKMGYLSKVQPDPALCPGEKLGGNVILEVDVGSLSSRIHNLHNINSLSHT